MKIKTIVELLDAKVLCGEDKLDGIVHSACGCDMMSDVLAFVKEQAVLLTGLCNPQVVRTALMMDMRCIVFVRGKIPSADILTLADEAGLVVLASDERMYTACGKLYKNGLAGGEVEHG
jgi:predicted transcriptional regulator